MSCVSRANLRNKVSQGCFFTLVMCCLVFVSTAVAAQSPSPKSHQQPLHPSELTLMEVPDARPVLARSHRATVMEPLAASSASSQTTSTAAAATDAGGTASSSYSRVHSGTAAPTSSGTAPAPSCDRASSSWQAPAGTAATSASSTNLLSSSSSDSAQSLVAAQSSSIAESDSDASLESARHSSSRASDSGSVSTESLFDLSESSSGANYISEASPNLIDDNSASSSFSTSSSSSSLPDSKETGVSESSSGSDSSSSSSSEVVCSSNINSDHASSDPSNSTIIFIGTVTRMLTVVVTNVAHLTAAQIIVQYCSKKGASATVTKVVSDTEVGNTNGYWQQVSLLNSASASGSYYRSFVAVTTDKAVLDSFVEAANTGGIQGVVQAAEWTNKNTKAGSAWIGGLVIGIAASVAAWVLIVMKIVFKRQHLRQRASVYSDTGLYEDLEMERQQPNMTDGIPTAASAAPSLPLHKRRAKW